MEKAELIGRGGTWLDTEISRFLRLQIICCN